VGEEQSVPSSENKDVSNQVVSSVNQEEEKGTAGSQAVRYFAAKKLKPYMRKKGMGEGVLKVENYPELQVMRSLNHPNVMGIRELIE
jgi:ABC-type transporter MlaC component